MHGWAFKGIRGQISIKIETDLEQWESFHEFSELGWITNADGGGEEKV